jgi:hypothetical protein
MAYVIAPSPNIRAYADSGTVPNHLDLKRKLPKVVPKDIAPWGNNDLADATDLLMAD